MENTCCFIGHRKISDSKELSQRLYKEIENLIINKRVDTFLLGSVSEFNTLCNLTLKNLKEIYPHIKIIYVRAEYQYISDSYKNYLLKNCDDTFFPEKIAGAGKAIYVERNYFMIDERKFVIVYYNPNYLPPKRKESRKSLFSYQPRSGTKLAFDYAVKKKKIIINLF